MQTDDGMNTPVYFLSFFFSALDCYRLEVTSTPQVCVGNTPLADVDICTFIACREELHAELHRADG